MNALSLFSGIAGLDLAIAPIATCKLYCESHPFCQEVLRKRMQTGDLEKAPIHEDIRTLDRAAIRRYIGNQRIDICTAGFPFEYPLHSCLQTLHVSYLPIVIQPNNVYKVAVLWAGSLPIPLALYLCIVVCCDAGQDISTAGNGRGLAGERSGLFFEVIRLVTRELPRPPTWLFLENVANIRKNGLAEVLRALASAGYDARWCTVSAASIGAHHTRRRWFCLARLRQAPDVAHAKGIQTPLVLLVLLLR